MSAIEPVKRRDPQLPVSPGMALRVAILGGIAVALFSVIFFRLWYLQVLSGEKYVQQADANRARDLPIPAPRGAILDREGKAIVASTTTNAVQIVPSALPPAGAPRMALYEKLGRLLGMSAARIEAIVVRGRSAVPYAPVTIKTDAGTGVLTVLGERANEYPGVIQKPVSIRSYPFGEMAGHVLGYVGSVSSEQLKRTAFRGVTQGTIVGQEGLEYYYDRYLRGTAGVDRVEVNASGYPVPSKLEPTLPKPGRSLRVTLDQGLQREAEKALAEGKEHAQASGKPAVAGAFVAMEPRSGQILAAGSSPGFDPNRFAKPLSPSEYKSLQGGSGGVAPLADRAVNGTYPTGSTFKPITALAALEAGVVSPGEGLGAGSCITVGAASQRFCNAGMADFGAVGLVEALKVSSDTYFFEVGARANSRGPLIQEMARKLGIGRHNGIDLPSEFPGIVPDAAWRQRQNKAEEACERRRHVRSCGIVAEIKPWTIGENMNLAVGQGDLLTDPLQMAVAYSSLANAFNGGGEGNVPTPHLGMEIDEANGGLVQSLEFPAQRRVHLNPTDLSLVMEGIHQAASQAGGTSAAVWQGWDQAAHPVYGKTGTAQHVGKADQAWYMCYIGDPKRPIVIAVTVEQGGFGAETAAPIARLMASKWFGAKLKFVAGSSRTF
ncbi:MAG TPA: penicillin-binding protein 2 [Solirubrobacteraceae bacterium]